MCRTVTRLDSRVAVATEREGEDEDNEAQCWRSLPFGDDDAGRYANEGTDAESRDRPDDRLSDEFNPEDEVCGRRVQSRRSLKGVEDEARGR